jgi:hypothetical protein
VNAVQLLVDVFAGHAAKFTQFHFKPSAYYEQLLALGNYYSGFSVLNDKDQASDSNISKTFPFHTRKFPI